MPQLFNIEIPQFEMQALKYLNTTFNIEIPLLFAVKYTVNKITYFYFSFKAIVAISCCKATATFW